MNRRPDYESLVGIEFFTYYTSEKVWMEYDGMELGFESLCPVTGESIYLHSADESDDRLIHSYGIYRWCPEILEQLNHGTLSFYDYLKGNVLGLMDVNLKTGEVVSYKHLDGIGIDDDYVCDPTASWFTRWNLSTS